MIVEYKNHIEVSDFERELVIQFRNLLKHGQGSIELFVRDHRVVKFDPHPHYENEKLLRFAEAQ